MSGNHLRRNLLGQHFFQNFSEKVLDKLVQFELINFMRNHTALITCTWYGENVFFMISLELQNINRNGNFIWIKN